jgi:hypothetical protein
VNPWRETPVRLIDLNSAPLDSSACSEKRNSPSGRSINSFTFDRLASERRPRVRRGGVGDYLEVMR